MLIEKYAHFVIVMPKVRKVESRKRSNPQAAYSSIVFFEASAKIPLFLSLSLVMAEPYHGFLQTT